MPRGFDVSIGQGVSCVGKTNRHVCAGAAKKFYQALSFGCWNDWIVIPGADPNAHG